MPFWWLLVFYLWNTRQVWQFEDKTIRLQVHKTLPTSKISLLQKTNSVQVEVCYRRSNDHIEAWAFLNHISLLQFSTQNWKITKAGLTVKYSAEYILDISRNIYKVILDDGQQIISEIAKKDRELLQKLDVELPIT